MGKGMVLTEAKGNVRKGKMIRAKSSKPRILRTIIENGREWRYHATKGWRSRRVEAAE